MVADVGWQSMGRCRALRAGQDGPPCRAGFLKRSVTCLAWQPANEADSLTP